MCCLILIGISILQEHCRKCYSSENRFASGCIWSHNPTQTFIDLLCVVHKNPKYRTHKEINSKALIQQGGNPDKNTIENITSGICTAKKLSEIFGDGFEYSSVILFEGAPGIGKTTIAIEIAYQWAVGNILTKIELLLLIFFRDPAVHNVQNFKDLIKYCYKTNLNLQNDCDQYFNNTTHGEGLMLIFDGFDELPQEANCIQFFDELLREHILPGCSVVVTSRSHNTAYLLQHCKCRVEIFGFTEEYRHEYLQQSQLSQEEYNTIRNFLQQNPIIDSLCYVPLNMANFIALERSGQSLPTTQTELIGESIRLIITQQIEKITGKINQSDQRIKSILSDLAKLAHSMTKKETLVVLENKVKKTGLKINDNYNVYGLLQSVQFTNFSEASQQRYYNFIHFSFQEYLAAYYLAEINIIKKSFKLRHTFWKPKYLGMWKMFAGITKGKDFSLQHFLSGENFITGKVRHFLKIKFPGIAKKIRVNKVKCLYLYQIFLEAPDSEIRQSTHIVITDKTINLSEEDLQSHDISIIANFIAKSYITMNWTSVNLYDCGINDHGCTALQHGLSLEDGRKKPAIQCLNLCHNKIRKFSTLMSLAHACKIKCLVVDNNGCSVDDFTLQETFKFTDSVLECLSLSFNPFTSENVAYICSILLKHRNLERLYLKGIPLTNEVIPALFSLFVELHNFEFLDYDDNGLIGFIMQQLRQGTIDFNGNLNYICNFIKIANNISNTSNSKFFDILSRISSLSLECNEAQENGMEYFIRSTTNVFRFFESFSTISNLNLSGIKLNKGTCITLSNTFENNASSLKILMLNRCDITTEAATNFFQKLRHAKHISEIQLCDNNIGDQAKDVLAVTTFCWDSLQTLKLENNRFTANPAFLFFLLSHKMYNSSLMIKIIDDFSSANTFVSMLECANNKSPTTIWFVSNIQNASIFNISQRYLNLENTQCNREIYSVLRQQLSDRLICVSRYFKEFTKLLELNLSGIIINHIVANELADAFETNDYLRSTLKILGLCSCGLQPTTATKLFKKLKYVKNIRNIEICHNFINNDAVEEMIISIVHWHSLEVFLFDNNEFGNFYHNLLVFLIKNYNFSGTQLYCNDPSSVQFLLRILNYIKDVSNTNSTFANNIFNVTVLQLQSTDGILIHDDASTFLYRFQNLIVLDLTGIIINQGVFNISFVSNFPQLQHLILNNCHVKSKTVIRLVQSLEDKNNSKLKELQLNNNKIDDEATDSLITAFLSWSSLGFLAVEGNNGLSFTSVMLLDLIKGIDSWTNFCDIKIDNDLHFRCFLTILLYISLHYNQIWHSTKSLHFLKNIQKIKCLTISARLAIPVHRYFKNFQYLINLIELNINDLCINESLVEILTKALAEKKTTVDIMHGRIPDYYVPLNKLTLKNCQVDSISIATLFKATEIMKHLKYLDLSFNKISDDAVYAMVTVFLQMPHLGELNVNNNEFKLFKDFQLMCDVLLQVKNSFLIDITNYKGDYVSAFLKLMNIMNDIITKNPKLNRYFPVEQLTLKNLLNHPVQLTENDASFLKMFTMLKRLELHGIIINFASTKIFAQELANNLQLLELSLINCRVTSDTVKQLLGCDKQSVPMAFNTLEAINLERNQIKDDGLDSLVKCFLQMPNLHKIKIGNNAFIIKEWWINNMFEVLFSLKTFNPTIEFTYNNVFIDTYLYLMGIMNDVSHKHSLQVQNSISINRLILCYPDSRKSPTLSENAARFLGNFFQLTELDFGNIYFESKTTATFAKVLENIKGSLSILSLKSCKFDFNIEDALVKFVSSNTVLTELKLSNNNLGSKGTCELAKGLASCIKLQKLYIDSNNITDEAAITLKDLMTKLYQHGNLTHVDLSRNKLSKQNMNSIYYAAGWMIWIKYKIYFGHSDTS